MGKLRPGRGRLLALAAPSFPVDLYPLLIKAVDFEPGTVSKLPGPRAGPYGPYFISSLPLLCVACLSPPYCE